MTDKKNAGSKLQAEEMHMPEMEDMDGAEMPEMNMMGHTCPMMNPMNMGPMMYGCPMMHGCPMMNPMMGQMMGPMEMEEHGHKKDHMRGVEWYDEDDDEYSSDDYDGYYGHKYPYKHNKPPYFWPPFYPYYPYKSKYHKHY